MWYDDSEAVPMTSGLAVEVVVADAGVSVAFVGVDEASRCPLQAMCVWAGDASVLLEIAPWPDALAVDSRTDTLHTNLEPRELRLDGLELALVHLDPYPEASESIPQDQYVATFGVRAAR